MKPSTGRLPKGIAAACLLLVLAYSAAGCTHARSPQPTATGPADISATEAAEPKTRPLPTACPNGHTELRDTPVLYGLLLMTPELRRRIDEGKVVAGGCIVSSSSPRRLLVCSRCGYRYNPLAARWERTSADPKSFQRPLVPDVSAFPLPEPRTGVIYRQVLSDGRVTLESASCWTRAPAEAVDTLIDRYLVDRGVTAHASHSEVADEPVVVEWTAPLSAGRTLTVQTRQYKGEGEIYVLAEVSPASPP